MVEKIEKERKTHVELLVGRTELAARFIEDLTERLQDLSTKLAKVEAERKQAALELQQTETTLRKEQASLVCLKEEMERQKEHRLREKSERKIMIGALEEEIMMLQVQRLPLSRQVSYNRVEEMEDELRVLKQENVDLLEVNRVLQRNLSNNISTVKPSPPDTDEKVNENANKDRPT